jgi:hypothetical protein
METSVLQAIVDLTRREQALATARVRYAGGEALRDQAEIALLEGDAPGPDEGW